MAFGGSWDPGKGPPGGLQRYYTHLSGWEVPSHKQGSKLWAEATPVTPAPELRQGEPSFGPASATQWDPLSR